MGSKVDFLLHDARITRHGVAIIRKSVRLSVCLPWC